MDRFIDMLDTFMVRRTAKAIDRNHKSSVRGISPNEIAMQVVGERKLRRIPWPPCSQTDERVFESEARLFEYYNRDTVLVSSEQLDRIVFKK